jgi:hypothetical protein
VGSTVGVGVRVATSAADGEHTRSAATASTASFISNHLKDRRRLRLRRITKYPAVGEGRVNLPESTPCASNCANLW